MTTTTNVVAEKIAELGGATNSGLKLGFIESGAYGAADDKWEVTNASEVLFCDATTDADGVANVVSDITTNTITLSSSTATAASALIIFR